ncbi:MAG TPA: peptidoglycan editing factor PgeF [Rubricoccaceae bacterium]|nr:peptidoglycan editing factor PgeF [Rubricoccaceae bacterium]
MILRPTVFDGHPTLVAGFTTRAFAGMEQSAVVEARTRLAHEFGFGAVASAGQVHGTEVAAVREGGHVPAHDGLVTDKAGLLLTVVSADCGLVLLADAEAGVVGACHAGWRGAVAGVVETTIGHMQTLGADPARLLAYVGPCIGTEAFEVGEEVATLFPPEAVVRRADWPKPHVDLRAALVGQLRALGVPDTHVEVSDACTASDLDRFYSYRAEGGTAGRMLGFIGRHT